MTSKLLIVLFLTTNICFAQNWIKTEITDFASVNFPGEPELTENPINNLYSFQDEYAFYLVSVRKLNAQQSSTLTEEEIPNFYRGVVRGNMNAANGTVVEMNDIIVQDIPALELEYVASNSDLPGHRFKRILYTNQTMISIEFWPLIEQEPILNEKKTEYFNSLTLNANKIDKTSAENNNLTDAGKENDIVYKSGYAIGYFIGVVISISVIIAVIVGLILIIKHILKKKKKKENINKSETNKMPKRLTIICGKCDTENNYESKYCNQCGYELKK